MAPAAAKPVGPGQEPLEGRCPQRPRRAPGAARPLRRVRVRRGGGWGMKTLMKIIAALVAFVLITLGILMIVEGD